MYTLGLAAVGGMMLCGGVVAARAIADAMWLNGVINRNWRRYKHIPRTSNVAD